MNPTIQTAAHELVRAFQKTSHLLNARYNEELPDFAKEAAARLSESFSCQHTDYDHQEAVTEAINAAEKLVFFMGDKFSIDAPSYLYDAIIVLQGAAGLLDDDDDGDGETISEEKTPHEITVDLLTAAKAVLGNPGETPSPAALERLLIAVVAFEGCHVKGGKL